MANHTDIVGTLPPPPGIVPNFVNPESRAYINTVMHSVCLTLVTLFLAIRIYTRKFICRWLGWDDCKTSLSETLVSTLMGIRYVSTGLCEPS